MTIIVSDDFTRAANAVLTAHVPTIVGTSWVQEINTTGSVVVNVLSASDNVGISATVAGGAILYTSRPNPTSAEYDVQFAVQAFPSGSDDAFAAIARYADANNHYVAGTLQAGAAADKRIILISGGITTELASGDTGLVANDVLKFECRNATKKLYRNGTEILSTTDNTLAAAGRAGWCTGDYFESSGDVAAAWRMDDYSVDEIAAPVAGGMVHKRRGAVKFAHMIIR